MEKKSYINPNVSPSEGGGTYTFLYWDEPDNTELNELIRFNSLDDTNTPSKHPVCTKIKDTV